MDPGGSKGPLQGVLFQVNVFRSGFDPGLGRLLLPYYSRGRQCHTVGGTDSTAEAADL